MGAAVGAIGQLAPLLGAGVLAYTMGNSMSNSLNSSASNLTALSNQQSQTALETLPDQPTDIDSGENAEAEAARQQQLQQMAANEASVNPTKGLGDTSAANTKKKTLGGV